MNALGETLNMLTSQIKFVSANNPGGGGGSLVPQTGDIIGIVLAIVAAIAIIAVGFIVASSKLRSSDSISGGALTKNKAIGIALSIVAVLSIAGILYCYMPSWTANAENNQAVTQDTGDTVYAYVDEVTGEITFDKNFVKNETNVEVSLDASNVVMTKEVMDIPGIDKVEFTINALNSVVYEGTLAKPDEQRTPYFPTMNGSLKPGEQAEVTYSIENCDRKLATALIGKTVLTTSVNEVACYSLTYSAGEGAEGEPPAPQILIPGKSVEIPGFDGLKKWGYKDADVWNASDGKTYKPGQLVKPDELTGSITLTPNWGEEEDLVTLYYQAQVEGVLSISQEAETIAPATGQPDGCTIELGDDYALEGWYNVDTEEEYPADLTFIPPRNEHNVYENAAYAPRVVYSPSPEDEQEPYTIIPNDTVTIKYKANTGGGVTLASETLATETSTPQGSTARVAIGYRFDHWNNAAGEEISRDLKLIPPKNESGVYESTTYTAMFSYYPDPAPVNPTCYNVYFESANTAQGTVSSSFALATANPYFTYSVEGSQVVIASSSTTKSYTIKAKGIDGFSFSHWMLVDESGTEVMPAETSTPISSNLTFKCYFTIEQESYTVHFAAGTGGDPVEPQELTMDAGTEYTIEGDTITFEDGIPTTVVANEGHVNYEFDHWVVTPSDTGSVDQELTFTATYKYTSPEMVTLTLKCWGGAVGKQGQPDKEEVTVLTGTNYSVVTSGKNIGDVIFTDPETGAVVESIHFTVNNGYKVEGWYWEDDYSTFYRVEDTGVIEEGGEFFYTFAEHIVTITYTVLDPATPQGDIVSNSGTQHQYVVTEQISKLNPKYSGAMAFNWDEDSNQKFTSTWNGWTNDADASKTFSDKEITSSQLKKFCESIWNERGWCDITFTAHFIAAKAIYNPSDGSFTFYNDELSHNEAAIDDYKFGINNSHFDITELDQSLSKVVFPTWYWPDGTPKVYPTSVHFDKSFKTYSNLKSMSLWFLSGMFDKSIFEMINEKNGSSLFDNLLSDIIYGNNKGTGFGGTTYQPRKITSVTGLENVNTDKLTETSLMFGGSIDDEPLNALDFSSWNTPVLKDTTGMFAFCTYLNDIKLPASDSGKSFAKNAYRMDWMFAACMSLKKINLTSGFGTKAVKMQGMFALDIALKEVNVDTTTFGSSADDMASMFYNCMMLSHIALPENHMFGNSCTTARYMFQNCSSLTSLDLTGFYAWNEKDGDEPAFVQSHPNYLDEYHVEYMLMGCYALSEVKLTSHFIMALHDYMYNPMTSIGSSGCDLCEDNDEDIYFGWYPDSGAMPMPMPGDMSFSTSDIYMNAFMFQMMDPNFSFIYRKNTPKAVCEGDTLSFYYDHEAHSGVTYDVRMTGALGSYLFPYEMEEASRLAKISNSSIELPIKALALKMPSFLISAAVSTVFPDWYDIYVADDGKITIKCAVDTTTVKFNDNFANYRNLRSTACWFCADSYGYQPFQTYIGLKNIPMWNVLTCSCMFGGFSAEVVLNEVAILASYNLNWWERSSSKLAVEETSVFDSAAVALSKSVPNMKKQTEGLPIGNMSSLMILAYVYFGDTYGTALHSFDFNELNWDHSTKIKLNDADDFAYTPKWHGPGDYPGFSEGNYSGMFANCVNLQTVTLPTWKEGTQQNEVWDDYYLVNADGMFYNCESLETIENFNDIDTRYLETCALMFYNCKSLKKLDFSNWDTTNVYGTTVPVFDEKESDKRTPYTSSVDMFKGCDNLVEVNFPQTWDMPLDFCGLPDNYASTGDSRYAWVYQGDNQPYKASKMLGLTVNTSERGWTNTMPGVYKRDKAYLKNYTISINSEDENTGTVSPSGDAIRTYSDKLEYCIDDFGLLVGNTRVQATPAEGYKLAYWTVEDGSGNVSRVEQMDLVNVYYSRMVQHVLSLNIPMLQGYIKAYEQMIESGEYTEEISTALSMYQWITKVATNALPYVEKSNVKFVAHFAKEGATPKAVYVENAVVDGRTENALYMYYDELDHSTEGTVFPIYENTGYSQHPDIKGVRNAVIDLIQSGAFSGLFNGPEYYEERIDVPRPVVFRALLLVAQNLMRNYNSGSFQSTAVTVPSWYYHTYATDNEINQWKQREHYPAHIVVFRDNERLEHRAVISSLAAAEEKPKMSDPDIYMNNLKSYFELLIEPQSVVFTDSFSQFDTLQSMSMWFMADSNGKQTVKHFYSPVSGQAPSAANEGFSNVNTSSLQNMQYAFGGYIDHSYNSIFNRLYTPEYTEAVELLSPLAAEAQAIDSADRLMLAEGFNPAEEYPVSALDLALDAPNIINIFDEDVSLGGLYMSMGTSIENLDLSTLDLSHTKNWSYMLCNAIGLKTVKFSDNVAYMSPTNFEGLFANCENLGSSIDGGKTYNENPIINLNKFNTEQVTNMNYMFYGDSHLVTLDLSSFNTNKVENTPVFISEQVLPGSVEESNPAKNLQNSHFAKYMFTQCYRLNKFFINSTFNSSFDSNIEGWDLNMGLSGLSDLMKSSRLDQLRDINYWTNVDSGADELFAHQIPYNLEQSPSPFNVLSGQFIRENVDEHNFTLTNEADEEGNPMGTVNGEVEYDYGYIMNATISLDAAEPNVAWVDNVRLEAQPKEGYRFKYWKFADGFRYLNEDQEIDLSGQIVPDGFSLTVTADMANYLHTEYSLVACYTDDTTTAKAILASKSSTDNVFDFVYDDTTYVKGQELEGRLQGYHVVEVYPIIHNTDDYIVPSWYRVISQSYRSGDGHCVYGFDKAIENTVTADNTLAINFEKSFRKYDELTSLSCWFMPALRNNSQFAPFNLSNMTGLECINTNRVNNVAYMFGGHEYFNDVNGNIKTMKINLDGFNATPLTNFDGLFANCIALQNIALDSSFYEATPTSTSKMFYNCRALNGGNLEQVLYGINTAKVTDMSYMFAWYSDNDPDENSISDYETYYFPQNESPVWQGFGFTSVETLEGMFAGHNATKEIRIRGSFNTEPLPGSDNYLKSISGMFKDCTYLENVDFPEYTNFKTGSVSDMSYLFANCTRLEDTEFTVWDHPDPVYLGQVFYTDSATNTSYMFSGCTGLKEFRLGYLQRPAENWSTVRIKNAVGMFANCTSLEKVDLSGVLIDATATVYVNYSVGVPAYSNMFTCSDGNNNYSNDSIKEIYIPEDWCYIGGSGYDIDYRSISLASCGLSSTYNDTGDTIMWIKYNYDQQGVAENIHQAETMNYTTNELGTVITNMVQTQYIPIWGYFTRANCTAVLNSSYSRIPLNFRYEQYYTDGGENYGETDYNTIAWNEDFTAVAYVGPCTYTEDFGGTAIRHQVQTGCLDIVIRPVSGDSIVFYHAVLKAPSQEYNIYWSNRDSELYAGKHELNLSPGEDHKTWNFICNIERKQTSNGVTVVAPRNDFYDGFWWLDVYNLSRSDDEVTVDNHYAYDDDDLNNMGYHTVYNIPMWEDQYCFYALGGGPDHDKYNVTLEWYDWSFDGGGGFVANYFAPDCIAIAIADTDDLNTANNLVVYVFEACNNFPGDITESSDRWILNNGSYLDAFDPAQWTLCNAPYKEFRIVNYYASANDAQAKSASAAASKDAINEVDMTLRLEAIAAPISDVALSMFDFLCFVNPVCTICGLLDIALL